MTAGPVPDPALVPTVSVEQAGLWLGLGRSASYDAAKRGEIPTLRFGRSLRVPVARLRILLGLDAGPESQLSSDGVVVPLRPSGA